MNSNANNGSACALVVSFATQDERRHLGKNLVHDKSTARKGCWRSIAITLKTTPDRGQWVCAWFQQL